MKVYSSILESQSQTIFELIPIALTFTSLGFLARDGAVKAAFCLSAG